MVLVLPVTSFPYLNLTELQLNSPTCPISYNSTHLTASISLGGCGTKTVVTCQIYAFNSVIKKKSMSDWTRRLYERTVITRSNNGIFQLHLKVNHLFSSILVRSWFMSTPCKVCVPPPWSEENHPWFSLWHAASLGSRPRDQSTGSTFPQRGRSLVRWPLA